MFIRPWVRVILARLKNPEGWHFGEHTVDLKGQRKETILSLWHCNGRASTKVWSFDNKTKPEILRFNFFEKWAVYRAMQQLKNYRHIEAEVDMQAEVIVKLTNLGD
jgi:hypothetical protein